MPRFFIAILSSILLINTAAAQNIRVASQPESVMIYTQGAMIKRSFSANIQQGFNDITITGISNLIDEQSIAIIAPPDIQITNVNYSKNTDPSRVPYRFRMAADSLDSLKIKLQLLINFKAALSEELLLLKENRKIAPSEKGVFVDDLEEAADFFRTRVADVLNKLDATGKKIEKLRIGINRLQAFLQQNPSGEIHLTIQSATDQSAVFGLSYHTAGVSWSPSYEIHIQDNQQAVLNYYANIKQLSGENWSNGQISLNTSPLYFSDSSILKPWIIGGNTSAGNRYSIVQTIFALNGLANLPSDTQATQILVKRELIDYAMQYLARPELSPYSFSLIQVPAWQDYNLLPGNIKIYNGNTYLGKVRISPSILNDTLNIATGMEEGIVVSRKKLKEVSQKQFMSNAIKQTFGYAVSIRNDKQFAQKITVEVHIPVSINHDIEVKVDNISKGIYDEMTGTLRWNITLAPGQSETIPYSWIIKYPKGVLIDGLE